MTPIERIDNKITELMGQYSQLTCGRAVAPPKAATIAAKIKELQQRRERLIAEERHSLGELLPTDPTQRNEVYRHLLRLPVVADFLYAACVDLQGLLKKHGMNELTLSAKVAHICRFAKELAFTLSQFDGTEAILSNDDEVIGRMFGELDGYLRNEMNITARDNDSPDN